MNNAEQMAVFLELLKDGYSVQKRMEVLGQNWRVCNITQDIIGLDMHNLKMHNIDLGYIALQKCKFTGCDIRDSLISTAMNTEFFSCNLSFANFSRGGAYYRDCNFKYSNMKNTTWYLSSVNDCAMDNCELEGAAMNRAKFSSVSLRYADLSRSTLRLSSFYDCDFYNASLMGADFSAATFTNCDFRRAYLASAIDIDGATFVNCIMPDGRYYDADTNMEDFTG